MKYVTLTVTLTGASGESAQVPAPYGYIMDGFITYTGQSGGTCDLTVFETIGSAEDTKFTLSNQNTNRRLPILEEGKGVDGAAISDQYTRGVPVFGGLLHMEIAQAAAGTVNVVLLVLD